jgi:hypothetical protein
MTDEGLRAQRDASLGLIDHLLRRGRALSAGLTAAPEQLVEGSLADTPFASAVRVWQQDCAAAINDLSGGSKAHWLARAYSRAFLVPSSSAGVVVEVELVDIVGRILDVLAQASASLTGMDGARGATRAEAAPARRFDFVHNEALRPVLEQAYRESGALLEDGAFQLALITACGILEAIVTDALEHFAGENVAGWSFEKRLAQAEKAGLIRGGWSRLPGAARRYRDGEVAGPGAGVSERDARTARQVLHVIMRDLDPGR